MIITATISQGSQMQGRISLSFFLRKLGFLLVVAVLLEVTVWNVEYYLHCFNQPVIVLENRLQIDGVLKQNDGSYLVTNPADVRISLAGLSLHLNSVLIDIQQLNVDDNQYRKQFNLKIMSTDEANALPFELGNRVIVPDVAQTKYLQLNLAGKSTEIILLPTSYKNDRLKLVSFVLNPRFPFRFSFIRILLCTLVLLVIYVLIPKHGFYHVACNFAKRSQRLVIATVMIFQIAFFTFCALSNPIFQNPPWYQFGQYHRLAVALSHFDLHISDIPSVPLTAMDNPYDTALRIAKDVPALADTAYYNGYYFCYFGVVVALVFHLPYYLITGREFPTYIGVIITSVAIVLLAFWLIAQLVKRFSMKKIPLLAYLILSVLLCSSSTYLVTYPCLYTIPIILGLAFTYLGLNLWLYSDKADKLCMPFLIGGSLSMALVAGCRPQMLLGSFLAVPIFWDSIVKRRLLFSVKTFLRTLLAILPYIIIGALLMAYNALRFSSPFDFGANYNITTNDVSRRGFIFSRIPLAILLFLFQPPSIQGVFPFFSSTSQATNYLGKTISEPTFGGLFFTYALSSVSMMVWKVRHIFSKHRSLWWIAFTSFILAICILVINAEAGGIVERYLADFNWLFMVSAIIIVLNTLCYMSENKPMLNIVHYGLSASCILNMFFVCMIPFIIRSPSDMLYTNPSLYYNIAYGLQFWL